MDSMWFLILGHFLGDYALQSDRMAKTKGERLPVLLLHVLIYVIALGITFVIGLWLTDSLNHSLGLYLIALAGIFIVHTLQDAGKTRFFACSRQAYYIDQALHVIQLFIIRLWLG